MKKGNLLKLVMNSQSSISRPYNLPENSSNYNFEENQHYSKKIDAALEQKEIITKRLELKELKKEELSKVETFRGRFRWYWGSIFEMHSGEHGFIIIIKGLYLDIYTNGDPKHLLKI